MKPKSMGDVPDRKYWLVSAVCGRCRADQPRALVVVQRPPRSDLLRVWVRGLQTGFGRPDVLTHIGDMTEAQLEPLEFVPRCDRRGHGQQEISGRALVDAIRDRKRVVVAHGRPDSH